MAIRPSFATSRALQNYNPQFLDTPPSIASAAPTMEAAPADLSNRLLQVLGGNLGGMLTGGDKLSALGALLKSVSRGSQTTPQQVMQGIQAQKLQEVQGLMQIQELRKQAMQRAQAEASLAAFAARLPEERRAEFNGLPFEEKLKIATRQESTGFDPVTGQQVYTSGPRTGEVIQRQIAGVPSSEQGSGLGRPGDLMTIGGVAGRINEKGVWEALPTRPNFVTQTRMINGKPTLVQVDTSTGKFEEVKPSEPTESERTAGFLTARLQNALKTIDQVTTKNPEAMRPSLRSETARALLGETAANALTDAARQQVEAAQLDALDAALTLGTGAAYTKEQLQGYQKAYFPQIGDSPATIASKKARFEQLVDAARIKAGRSAPAPEKPKGRSGGAKTFTIGGKQFTISPKG